MTLSLLLAVALCACSANKTIGSDSPTADSRASEAAARDAVAELYDRAQTPSSTDQKSVHSQVEHQFTPAIKPDGIVTVVIDTFKVFNEDISLKDARAQTLSMARELALAEALPEEIRITTLTTDMYVERNARFDESIATSIYLMSSSAGNFLEEKILEAEPVFSPETNSFVYHIRYWARIQQAARAYNSAIDLRVKLSNTLLRDGERIDLDVTANRDGYLYIFDFLPDNSVALVFPTYLYRNNRLKAVEKWSQKIAGKVEPGKDFSIETLYFVFSTEEITGWEGFKGNASANELVWSAGEESFLLFQKWLGRSDPSKRVEKMAQLHIFKDNR